MLGPSARPQALLGDDGGGVLTDDVSQLGVDPSPDRGRGGGSKVRLGPSSRRVKLWCCTPI